MAGLGVLFRCRAPPAAPGQGGSEWGQRTNPLARERAARGAEQAATVVLSN
jgi:hypothetical protein